MKHRISPDRVAGDDAGTLHLESAFRDIILSRVAPGAVPQVEEARPIHGAVKESGTGARPEIGFRKPMEEASANEAADAIESHVTQGQEDAEKNGYSLLDPEKRSEEMDLARSGAAKIASGERPSAREMLVFEAVVSLVDRPVLDIVDDDFGAAPQSWEILDKKRAKLNRICKSVARIELLPNSDGYYGGTGFVVGPNLVMTNRHVAEMFASGSGLNATISSANPIWLDFKRENRKPVVAPTPFEVRKVVMIHPFWDIALLEVEDLDHQPLTFAGAIPKDMPEMINEKRPVAIIGFPAMDFSLPLDIQARVFRNTFGVKRLQPGTIRGERMLNWYDHDVPAFAHDISTLGGNSGSAIIDLETGFCLGIHFAGEYRVNNYANPSWLFTLDRVLTEEKLSVALPPGTQPAEDWLSQHKYWADLPAPTPPPPESAPSAKAPVAADWYERHSDDEIADLWLRDPERVEDLLSQVLEADEARSFIAQLKSIPTGTNAAGAMELRSEGLWPAMWTKPATDQADVVVLHGIMGSHLAFGSGLMSRLWLNPASWLVGDFAERLMLGPDGLIDYTSGSALRADGIIRFSYGGLLRYLRQERFGVDEFSFDWRKSLRHSADLLHLHLQQRRLQSPQRKIALMAHSMGGLVAAMCAQRHPEIMDWLDKVVLLGSPLHGSFAPLHAALGSYDMLVKLAALSRKDSIEDLRLMSISFPGLLEMLPDPDRIPGADALYSRSTWPREFAPPQKRLDEAREVQQDLWSSPLLNDASQVHSVVSKDFGTTCSFERAPLLAGPHSGPGDGTVPIQLAWHPGLRAYHASASHGLMPRDGDVQSAVKALLLGADCPLRDFDPAEITTTQPHAELAVPPVQAKPEMVAAEAQVRRNRFQEGLWTQNDWDWLTAQI